MVSRGQFISSLGVLGATLGQRGCACGSRGGLVGSGGAPGRLLDAFGDHFGPIWETLGSLFCFWGSHVGHFWMLFSDQQNCRFRKVALGCSGGGRSAFLLHRCSVFDGPRIGASIIVLSFLGSEGDVFVVLLGTDC